MTLELVDRPGVRAALRRGPMLLHPECPIEQAVTSADPFVQDSLLREIWRRTPAYHDGVVLIAQPDRLRVLARTEALLRPAIDALTDRHGAAIVVHAPQVRYALGPPVLEPYMTLLVAGDVAWLPQVRRDLHRRRARPGRFEQNEARFTLEAEAPLAALLGYADWIDRSANGVLDAGLWLSRYLPIDDEGPSAA